METGVNDNTLSYFTARTTKLTAYERNVVLIADKIYTAQQVEYTPQEKSVDLKMDRRLKPNCVSWFLQLQDAFKMSYVFFLLLF